MPATRTPACFPAPALRAAGHSLRSPPLNCYDRPSRIASSLQLQSPSPTRASSSRLKAFGRFTYEPDSPETTPATVFDLASVTKVVATTSMAMILYERGLLDLDLPVVAVVAEFAGEDPRRDAVTLRMLLAHSSGLPAYEKLFSASQDAETNFFPPPSRLRSPPIPAPKPNTATSVSSFWESRSSASPKNLSTASASTKSSGRWR